MTAVRRKIAFKIKFMQYIELDYFGQKTATYYFEKVAHLPYSLLLDSGQTEGDDGRYDILLCQPNEVLISQNGKHLVKRPSCNQQTEIADCFEQLNLWLSKYNEPDQNKLTKDLPFTGGIAGAFAYDLGRQLESIDSIAKNDTTIPDLVAGTYWCPLIIDHQNQSAFLYDFSPQQDSLKTIQRLYSVKTKQKAFSRKGCNFKLTSPWQSNMTQEEYSNKFECVKSYIKAGDCYQINLAQRFTASYQGDVWQAYEHLNQLNGAPFSAYFNFECGTLLSLSPERFIRVDGDNVVTQPIKGTRPRSSDPKIDDALKSELFNSEKDRAENLMIVDLLRNDLGRTAIPGSVKVTELFGCYSFPSVHHLISTIESKIDNETTAVDVLKEAFPGGSITGAPKVRAMEIIEELEPNRRHFYCGSIAYFSFNGRMDSSILIRTLMAKGQTLYAWAGGGLVDDSQCDLEYQETFAKLSKILEPLSQL